MNVVPTLPVTLIGIANCRAELRVLWPRCKYLSDTETDKVARVLHGRFVAGKQAIDPGQTADIEGVYNGLLPVLGWTLTVREGSF